MKRQIFYYVAFSLLLTSLLHAQHFRLDANIELTGASFTPSSEPERTINANFRDDDPFNPVRGKLFPSIRLNDMIGFEAEFLFDNKAKKFDRSKNQPFRADGFFLSIKGLFDKRLNFWLGRIPTPVGTFSPRSYSHVNPLIGFPLAYQYKVPYNAFQLSSETSNLFLRDNNLGGATSIYEACWITGVSAFGNIEGTEYMLAIGQGTLTNPEAKSNKGFQLAGRIGRSFTDQFNAGVSAGIAPYLEYDNNLPAGTGVRDPKHFIGGIDASAHFSNLHIIGEAFYNSWDTPQYQTEKNIRAVNWYLEGQYFLLPNLYGAVRVNQMLFTNITDPSNGQQTPWGYNITRIESGIGFLPTPELNFKAVVQYNRLDTPSTKDITIVALQAAFHFENLQKFIGMENVEKPVY